MGFSIVMELVNMFIHGNILINWKGRIGGLSHCPCLELLSLAEPGRSQVLNVVDLLPAACRHPLLLLVGLWQRSSVRSRTSLSPSHGTASCNSSPSASTGRHPWRLGLIEPHNAGGYRSEIHLCACSCLPSHPSFWEVPAYTTHEC